MKRAALLFLLVCAAGTPCIRAATTFDLSTATVLDIQAAMDAGVLTSEKLVEMQLARIAAYDQAGPKLNTVITLNPNALAEARALDAERREKGPRSPLHGVTLVAKDVFDTKDLPTTGGFWLMKDSQPSRDAFVVDRLRQAGVIVLAKLNQSDWYGVGRNGGGTFMGPVVSPYNAIKYGGGSSTGTGAAMGAWFATLGLGSDTTGSVINPTTLNGLVGMTATRGLVSRTGMMWSSPRQEAGGPMVRSVADLAAMLDVIAGYDPADLATEACIGKLPTRPYASFARPDGLRGARIGVLREMFRSGPGHEEGLALMEQALTDMKKAGAVLVDPALTGIDLVRAQDDADAAPYERAVAIDAYLAGLPADAPVRSVAEMIAKGGDRVKPSIVEAAALGSIERNAALAAVYRQQDMLREALVGLMDRLRLDALVLPFRTFLPDDVRHPVTGGRWQRWDVRNHLHSSTGLPTIAVPGGAFPSDGMPFGVQFLGRAFSEPKLLELAAGYEAATNHRKPPPSTPALAGETIAYTPRPSAP
jgi:Asp-tRNA(Asn)/Glu-tRNA(Gln) amidotransferase A subunit family amidase